MPHLLPQCHAAIIYYRRISLVGQFVQQTCCLNTSASANLVWSWKPYPESTSHYSVWQWITFHRRSTWWSIQGCWMIQIIEIRLQPGCREPEKMPLGPGRLEPATSLSNGRLTRHRLFECKTSYPKPLPGSSSFLLRRLPSTAGKRMLFFGFQTAERRRTPQRKWFCHVLCKCSMSC